MVCVECVCGVCAECVCVWSVWNVCVCVCVWSVCVCVWSVCIQHVIEKDYQWDALKLLLHITLFMTSGIGVFAIETTGENVTQ